MVKAGVQVEDERRRALGELHQGKAEFVRDAQRGVQTVRPTACEQGVELVEVGGSKGVAADVVAVKAGAPGAGVVEEEVRHGFVAGAEKAPIISARRRRAYPLECAAFFLMECAL